MNIDLKNEIDPRVKTKTIFTKKNGNTIELKENAFYINNKAHLIRGTSFQWFKMPKEIWEDRIQRAKSMGYNTLDIYVAWKNHEAQEGKFDFKTFDLKGFLELCKKHKMFVYLRPGPYICNEQDAGGLPPWLFTKTDKRIIDPINSDGLVNLRTNEKDFMVAVEKYYSRVNKEILPYLFTNGGPIIMYSIENEYDAFKPVFEMDKLSTYKGERERPKDLRYDTKDYFEKLRNIALKTGIDVPITTCPGFAKIVETGDVKNVIPMPNFYAGLRNAEYRSKEILKDMHSDNHEGNYKEFPAGITETYREANHLRRLILGGMDVIFQFNNIGYSQQGYQNPVFIHGYPPDDFNEAAENARNMIGKTPSHINTAFVRPGLSYFPGKGDYYGTAISPSGVLRDNFYNIRRTNLFVDSFQEQIAQAGEPNRTSQNLFLSGQDRRVKINSSKFGIKDPDQSFKTANYWLSVGKDGALIGLHNQGIKDEVAPRNCIEAMGESFPKFTNFCVPMEEGNVIYSKGNKEAKEYTMLLPYNFAIGDNLKLKYSTSEVLALKNFKNEKVLVVYGKEGTQGELSIKVENPSLKVKNLSMQTTSDGVKINELSADEFTVSYTHGKPKHVLFTDGNGNRNHIVILDRYSAGRTWFTSINNEPMMISNVDYIENDNQNPILHLATDRKIDDILTFSLKPVEVKHLNKKSYYNENSGFTQYSYNTKLEKEKYIKVDISSGKVKDDENEAMPEIDTSSWISLGDKPDNLEKYGINKGHAWYRAEFDLDAKEVEKNSGLWIEHAGDFEGIYINGKYISTLSPLGTEINSKNRDRDCGFEIPKEVLKEGKNTIAFRTEIWGHGSLMASRGTIDSIPLPGIGPVKVPFMNINFNYFGVDSMKGLEGTANFNDKPLKNWKLRQGLGGELKEFYRTDMDETRWDKRTVPIQLKPGEIMWYRTHFNSSSLPNPKDIFAPMALNIKGENAKATVYLNGELIGRWISDNKWLRKGGWFNPFRETWTQTSVDSFPIPQQLVKTGENTISIAFEDTADFTTTNESGKIAQLDLSLAEEKNIKTTHGITHIPLVYRKIKI